MSSDDTSSKKFVQSLDDAAAELIGQDTVKILVHESDSENPSTMNLEIIIIDDEGWWEFPTIRSRKHDRVLLACAVIGATAAVISMVVGIAAMIIQLLVLGIL